MQFKMPQDVERADAVFFGLTWTQIIIMVVGGTISYMLFVTLSKNFVFLIWIWPVGFFGMLTLATALLRIQDIPFYRFFILMMEFFLLPRQRYFASLMGVGWGSVFDDYETKKEVVKVEDKDEVVGDYAGVDDLAAVLDGDLERVAMVADEHLLGHSFVGVVDHEGLKNLDSQKV